MRFWGSSLDPKQSQVAVQLTLSLGKNKVPRDSNHKRYKTEGFQTQKRSTSCVPNERCFNRITASYNKGSSLCDWHEVSFSTINAENRIRVFIQPRSETETKWRLYRWTNRPFLIKFPVHPSQLHPFHKKLNSWVSKFHGRKISLFLVLVGCFSTSPYKSLLSEQEVNWLGFKEVRLRYFTAVRLLRKVIPTFQFHNAETLEITHEKFIIHETGVASLTW